MNLNCDTYIKQEFFNAEEELIKSIPSTDLNIPIKNEPISDESFSSITIKSETLSEATYTAETVPVKTENSLQNQQIASRTGDSFIIYELESPPATHKLPTLSQETGKQILTGIPPLTPKIQISNNIQTKQNPSVVSNLEQSHVTHKLPSLPQQVGKQILKRIPPSTPKIQISNNILTKQVSVRKNTSEGSNLEQSIVRNKTKNHIIIPPKVAASPPILLNSQLRKRHKVILPVNPVDKRTRYNIEGTAPAQLDTSSATPDSINSTDISNTRRLLNTGSKKIINHFIKHKRSQRKKQDYASSESPTDLRIQNKDRDNTFACTNSNQNLSTMSSQNVSHIITNTQTELDFINTSSPASTSPLSMTQNVLNSPKQTVDPPIISELRVKCLCSLTDDTTPDNSDLKAFFKEMFEETRHLNKTQQRKVKMSLLKAISEAEELMEQGKCCGFL